MATQTTEIEITFADMIEMDLPGQEWSEGEVTQESTPYPEAEGSKPHPMPLPPVEDANVGVFGAHDVNERCKAVVLSEDAVLKDAGIGKSELLYAEGNKLADVGHAQLERDAAEYAALPSLSAQVAHFKALIQAEDRKDTICDLRGVRVDSGGQLATLNVPKPPIAIEDMAWRQLQSIAKGPNVNLGLSRAKSDLTQRVRARTIRGERSTFAIVSSDRKQGYTVFDGHQVVDCVAEGLRDAGMVGSKAELTYEQATTRYNLRTILQAPIDIPSFRGVGRVHQIFLDVSGGDDGNASVKGQLGAIRVRCMNASKSQAKGMEFRRIHKGNLSDIRGHVKALTRQFSRLAESLQAVWTKASANYYLDPSGGRLSPPEAIARMVRNGLLPMGERTEVQAIDRYVSAWRAEESPASADGIVMAVQRAAHESDWGTKWATDEIEDVASTMLYQPVYVLAEGK